MIANTTHILAIEWLAAAQGIGFLRPLASSPALEEAMIILRAQVPALMRDRHLAPDLAAATAFVHPGALSRMFRSLPALVALWVPA